MDCRIPVHATPPHLYAIYDMGAYGTSYRHEACYRVVKTLIDRHLLPGPFNGLTVAWDALTAKYSTTPRKRWPKGYLEARQRMVEVRQLELAWRRRMRAQRRARAEVADG